MIWEDKGTQAYTFVFHAKKEIVNVLQSNWEAQVKFFLSAKIEFEIKSKKMKYNIDFISNCLVLVVNTLYCWI